MGFSTVQNSIFLNEKGMKNANRYGTQDEGTKNGLFPCPKCMYFLFRMCPAMDFAQKQKHENGTDNPGISAFKTFTDSILELEFSMQGVISNTPEYKFAYTNMTPQILSVWHML